MLLKGHLVNASFSNLCEESIVPKYVSKLQYYVSEWRDRRVCNLPGSVGALWYTSSAL